LIAIVVGVSVVLAGALFYWLLSSTDDRHESISIDGNDDFNSAHGVRQGSGTPQDPFVIEDITILEGEGFSIGNTDAHVVIRNLTVEALADSGSGVFVRYSENVHFEHLTVTNTSTGLYVDRAENCSFVGCIIDGVRSGQSVSLYSSLNCTLSDSWISNQTGINAGSVVLGHSIECRIVDVELTDCKYGIFITNSESCVISENSIHDSYHAISIDSSLNLTITRNNLSTNILSMGGYELRHYSTHTIAEDNSVNGLPLLYVNGASGVNIQNLLAGQLIAVNCSDFGIRDLSFDEGSHEPILLAYCCNGIVENISISGGTFDWTDYSSYYSYHSGVTTTDCNNIIITSCTISNVTSGIGLRGTNLQATWNNLTNNEYGIGGRGINLTISNNTLSHNREGISTSGGIHGSTDCVSILDNTISYGQVGIKVSEASNITVRGNKIMGNSIGAQVQGYYYRASNIVIHQNDFIENSYQVNVQAGNVSASWNTEYPVGGNYWSDYSGTDINQGANQTVPGSDGIGDSPYHVFTASLTFGDVDFWDEYPLMSPCTN